MKDKTLIKLGKNLKSLRELADISQEELAGNANLHRNFVGMIERAEREVGIKKLIQIAQALKAKPSDIFKGIL